MNDLDKMNPELAARIILLHTNDVIQETYGGLDSVTQDLFKVPIPKFELGNFAYTSSQFQNIAIDIMVTYPGTDTKHKLMILVEPIKNKKIKDVSYMISYKVFMNWPGGEAIRLTPNWIGTPLIRTDVIGDIFLNEVYYNIGVTKVFVNFMEALFLREFLKVRPDRICEAGEDPFTFFSHECSSLLYGLGELLIPQNINQLDLWKEG